MRKLVLVIGSIVLVSFLATAYMIFLIGVENF